MIVTAINVYKNSAAIKRLGHATAMGIWLLGAYLFVVPFLVPASYWFAVDRVVVKNSVEGVAPEVLEARTIKHPFHARWTVTIRNKNGNTFCSASYEQDYRTYATLPDYVDLDWWIGPTKCNLPAGTYTMLTTWRWRYGMSEKEVEMLSNIFQITPKQIGLRENMGKDMETVLD